MKNKTFRLFVSSTFNDFKEERNLLHDEVLPRVKDFCYERGYEFQMIDLRWGIYSEATLNHKTLSICLDEIKKCKEFSPHPNFLVMVGERYGWIPLPPFIAQTEFTCILEGLAEGERSLLSAWYLPDENEEGGQFYLKPRSDAYTEDAAWADLEDELRALLLKGAQRAELDHDRMIKYTASATEHEVINGFFGDAEHPDSGIALFRTGYPSKDSDPGKIDALKRRISDYMKTAGTLDNLIALDYDGDYGASFVAEITDALLSSISCEIERLEEIEDVQSQSQRLLPYYHDESVYVGNEQTYDAISEYMRGESRHTLFVTGDSGCGKTTLLAKILLEYAERSTFVFYGENSRSCSILDAVEHIVEDLHRRYAQGSFRTSGGKNLAETFWNAINLVPHFGKPHVIVFDGIDMFSDLTLLKENFLPTQLPRNVKLLISSADADIVRKLMGPEDTCLTLGKLSASESQECFRGLMSRRHRRLGQSGQKQTVDAVLAQGCTPLQVKLLVNLASKWKSSEIHTEIPQTALALAAEYIRHTYEVGEHDRDTVLYCLALIAVAPLGLTEQDILSMLPQFPSVKAHFLREMKHEYDLTNMPYAIWSRLFFDLEDCLEISFYSEEIVVKFSHNIFFRVMREFFSDYCEEATSVLMQYLQRNAFVRASYARMEFMILSKQGRIQELAERLTDLKYVAFSIRNGDVLYLTEQLSGILPTLYGTPLYDQATRMLECLTGNWPMLYRYRSEFDLCAYEHKLITSPTPYLYTAEPSPPISAELPSKPFFYGEDAKLSWAPSLAAYAVYERSYVYICDAESCLEKTRIYVEPEKDEKSEIFDVKWLSCDMIAVTTYRSKILVYHVADGAAQKWFVLDGSIVNPVVELTDGGNSLIYCEKDHVVCMDLVGKRVKYRIPLPSQQCVCMSDDRDRIIIRGGVRNKRTISYSVYGAQTGELLRTFSKPNTTLAPCETRIFDVVDNRLLQIWTENGYHGFFLQDSGSSFYAFLHPPKYREIIQHIVGYRYWIAVYENGLFAVDLRHLRASYMVLHDITNVAWIVRDERISVLTATHKLMEFELSSFSDAGAVFSGPINLLWGSAATMVAPLGDYVKNIRAILPRGSRKEYCAYFTTWYDDYQYIRNADGAVTPTLLTVARDGKKTVAYEYQNSVVILSAHDEPLFWVENLSLGIDNNILRLSFSPDSRYLLIWTNRFVRVVCIESRRFVCNLSMARRPATTVRFTADGKLLVMLSDGKRYEATLTSKTAKFVPRLPGRMMDVNHAELYSWAYYANSLEDTWPWYNIIDARLVDRMSHASEWINHNRGYFGEKQWLLYQNGRFYLNGDYEKGFSNHADYDFAGVSIDCASSYSTSAETYISEKNDITSELFEYGSQEYLLLVCKKMNSVILFDIREMKIAAAYKTTEKIIGASMNEAMDALTLFLCSAVRTITLKIRLPDR